MGGDDKVRPSFFLQLPLARTKLIIVTTNQLHLTQHLLCAQAVKCLACFSLPDFLLHQSANNLLSTYYRPSTTVGGGILQGGKQKSCLWEVDILKGRWIIQGVPKECIHNLRREKTIKIVIYTNNKR